MADRPMAPHPAHSNPFAARFGKVPTYFAGRDEIISEITPIFEDGRDSACCLLVGARGAGKTALLTYFSNAAEQTGWLSANVSALPGMLDDILQQTKLAAAHMIEPDSRRKLTSISVAALGAVEWENVASDPPNWRIRMSAVLDQLNAAGIGLLITVDEVNVSLDEMVELVSVFQHFVREDRKVALLMAGLPYNVESLIKGKSTSFLRRADRFDLPPLTDYEVEEAFKLTVEEGGKLVKRDALDEAIREIGGFPFMFQLLGHRAWRASADRSAISLEDVKAGARGAREQLEARIFDTTYAELSKADRSFLLAMLDDEGATTRASLMGRLKRPSSHVSTYKNRLIQAGIIDEDLDGNFRFVLPGFREYLEKHA